MKRYPSTNQQKQTDYPMSWISFIVRAFFIIGLMVCVCKCMDRIAEAIHTHETSKFNSTK